MYIFKKHCRGLHKICHGRMLVICDTFVCCFLYRVAEIQNSVIINMKKTIYLDKLQFEYIARLMFIVVGRQIAHCLDF